MDGRAGEGGKWVKKEKEMNDDNAMKRISRGREKRGRRGGGRVATRGGGGGGPGLGGGGAGGPGGRSDCFLGGI